MKTTRWPKGLMTAIVTPLRNDEIDHDSLAALIDFQVASGTSGLVVSGGTGEYCALTLEERRDLIRSVVDRTRGRIPVIAATGCLSTRDAIRLSQEAEQLGVNGLLIASAYGEPINWRERYAFYAELDANVSVPVMIYNTPPTGLLDFDQIRQLSELRNISAVKDSSGNPELMGDLLAWADADNFAVYVGKDSFLYEAISAGARGAVFGAANFLPSELTKLISTLHTSGSTRQSLELWAKLRPLLRVMETASNYVGLCKAGCKLRGVDVGVVRKPYMMPEASEIERLALCLKHLA